MVGGVSECEVDKESELSQRWQDVCEIDKESKLSQR